MLIYIILVIILVLSLLLLFSNVGVRLVFESELRMWVKVGFLRVQLYPIPERKKKTAKRKKKVKEAKRDSRSEGKRTERKITFEAVWQLIIELTPVLLAAMEHTRKGMRIRCLKLHLTISDRNPAIAAQRYGKMNAVIWPLIAAIENAVTVEQRNVRLDLDFSLHKTRANGEIFITMRMYRGIHIFLADGRRMLKLVLDFMKAAKVDQDHRSMTIKKPTDDTAA